MAIKTLMTAAEFAKSGPATDNFELVRGELVRMPPPKKAHGRVCGNVVFLLKGYLKKRGKGELFCNDTGLLTQRDPDTVRGVDVMVYLVSRDSKKRINKRDDDYDAWPPDLAVEVRSPGQSWRSVIEKVTEYLVLGARMVWVIDPKVQRVTVFTPDSEPMTLAAENELDGGDALPGFRCGVAEFFE